MEQTGKWVTAWGNAVSINERRPENYGRNLTLRYPVKMMLDGSALRITLDNFCGTEPVTISQVLVARSTGEDGIDAASSCMLTFAQEEAVTIPAGARRTSDPLPFAVKAGEELAVSLYLAEFTELRSAVHITGPLSKGYYAVGNHTESAAFPMDVSRKTNWFYFLSDIMVLTAEENRTIVCYGDSITAQAWPDFLMQRVLAEGRGKLAVIRKAASGTRILRQYHNITYDCYGLRGAVRFPHEVPVAGADTVIIQHGINDIIHPVGTEVNPFRPWSELPTAEELIDGLRNYLRLAHEYGLKAYLGTLLPIEGWRTYADFREQLRQDVNDWMRSAGEADGCIDFDLALRDARHPSAFAAGYDSGDHLHPSLAAYERMAQAVPEALLQ